MNIVAKNLHEFKTKMIQKRGLIECYGESKMNKARRSVLERQAEIKRTCRAMSALNIEAEIEMLPQLLHD